MPARGRTEAPTHFVTNSKPRYFPTHSSHLHAYMWVHFPTRLRVCLSLWIRNSLHSYCHCSVTKSWDCMLGACSLRVCSSRYIRTSQHHLHTYEQIDSFCSISRWLHHRVRDTYLHSVPKRAHTTTSGLRAHTNLRTFVHAITQPPFHHSYTREYTSTNPNASIPPCLHVRIHTYIKAWWKVDNKSEKRLGEAKRVDLIILWSTRSLLRCLNYGNVGTG